MRNKSLQRGVIFFLISGWALAPRGAVVVDTFSAYHHIQVVDQGGLRTLRFNGSMETKMSLANPLQGHFEYTEYFHTPWLWNTNLQRVLMLGLGGGSAQRSYGFYYTNVLVDTAELDPVVINVAKKYFGVTERPMHKIHNDDGRVFLRRTTNRYDALIIDAYTTTRYGSSIPPHLTTREFFAIASDRLTTNGVVAYNVIGQVNGWQANLIGSLYRTMKEVFPRVYLFPARQSQNVVLVATKSAELFDQRRVQQAGADLVRQRTVRLPTFQTRLQSFLNAPPATAAHSPVLTDDQARVEGLLR